MTEKLQDKQMVGGLVAAGISDTPELVKTLTNAWCQAHCQAANVKQNISQEVLKNNSHKVETFIEVLKEAEQGKVVLLLKILETSSLSVEQQGYLIDLIQHTYGNQKKNDEKFIICMETVSVFGMVFASCYWIKNKNFTERDKVAAVRAFSPSETINSIGNATNNLVNSIFNGFNGLIKSIKA